MTTATNMNAVLVTLATFVGGGLLVGCGSTPLTAPTAYNEFNSTDGTFACDYPADWSADGGGRRGPEWATFRSGPAEIRINADVVGSLMGDIARSVGPRDGEMLTLADEPVHKVHVRGKEAAEGKYAAYEEVGGVAELDVSLGPARYSEFTASSTFGSGLRGYRATILAHDKRVVVYCVCPESDWQTLQPAFDHVLNSLRRGQRP